MDQKSESTGSMALQKCPTGISGLDEITGGGLPAGRPTLVCGGAGSGKTLFAMQFLVSGATRFDEPGVFISFEESEHELAENVASLGWELASLGEQKKIFLDHVYIERSEIEETGEFNLDGLFIRIESAVRAVNARRIAIDTIEALFGGFADEGILRAEIRRLFRWLKDKNLTAIITGEKGERTFTRSGLEEYVSDCVIFLDHRMIEQVATRRLRILKYRGTAHGTNEYPFLITKQGFSVHPITALEMNYAVSNERISSGIPRFDAMLGGKGFYRGSSILVSGAAGSGKSSLSACVVDAACRRGERVMYFAFEEAPQQIIRNMGSIGLDLKPAVHQGLLQFLPSRSVSVGLESHLSLMLKHIDDFDPAVAVVDPISNLSGVADPRDVKEMLTRLTDYLKLKGITSLFTDLTYAGGPQESTDTAISSLMDTWILLPTIEHNGERNRGIYVLKSRGMAHSNQVREFLITENGLQLKDVYIGPGGVLTGTARVTQEAIDGAEALARSQKIERLRRELQRKESLLHGRLQVLQDAFASEREEIENAITEAQTREEIRVRQVEKLARMRGRDQGESSDGSR